MSNHYPEFSLLELVEIVTRRKRLFLALVLLAPLLAWGASHLIEPRYDAVSSLLPVQNSSVQGYSSILERGVIRGGLRIRSAKVRNSVNLERLLGRQLRYEIVDEMGLVEFFDLADEAEENPERARELAAKRLLDATHLAMSLKVRVLMIHVVTRDPEMSARIANGYIEALDRHNLATIRRDAASRVAYLDRQLEKLRNAAAVGRSRLLEYREGAGISDFDAQTASALEILGELRKKLLELEMRHASVSADYSADHPELQLIEAEMEVYRNTLERFSAERAEIEADGGEYVPYLDIPLASASRHELAVAHLDRELELLDALNAALVAERERSRMEQFLDIATTSVLDRAVVPSEPIWPRRKMIVLVSTFITLFVVYLALFAREAFFKMAGGRDRAALRRFLAES